MVVSSKFSIYFNQLPYWLLFHKMMRWCDEMLAWNGRRGCGAGILTQMQTQTVLSTAQPMSRNCLNQFNGVLLALLLRSSCTSTASWADCGKAAICRTLQCSEWLKSQFCVAGSRGGSLGRGFALCALLDTHRNLCVYAFVCAWTHMVHGKNQNRAAPRSAVLQWQPEEETGRTFTKPLQTAAWGSTDIILHKEATKSQWTTPGLSKMRLLLWKVFPWSYMKCWGVVCLCWTLKDKMRDVTVLLCPCRKADGTCDTHFWLSLTVISRELCPRRAFDFRLLPFMPLTQKASPPSSHLNRWLGLERDAKQCKASMQSWASSHHLSSG